MTKESFPCSVGSNCFGNNAELVDSCQPQISADGDRPECVNACTQDQPQAGVNPYSLSARFGNYPEFVDICSHDQSQAMFEFLQARGLPVEMCERGYMIIRERHAGKIREALELIFNNRLEGWWNLRREIIARGVCSAEEFEKARNAMSPSGRKEVA